MVSVDAGLAQVEVGESAISLVEGKVGRLSYRGIPIETLVEWEFSKVCYLVITGEIPKQDTLSEFESALFQASKLNTSEIRLVMDFAALKYVHPMQVLQSLSPAIDTSLATECLPMFELDLAKGLTIAAKLPSIIALLRNIRLQQWQGNAHELAQILEANAQGTDLNHRFLQYLDPHKEPAQAHIDAFRATQILQIEHSFNASTFAARVVASTLSPVSNVLAAAFGTLHGRLHGGADQAALQTAESVGDPARAAAFVDNCLKNGEKVMGMGHREYKIVDPRAIFLKNCARELSRNTAYQTTFETLEAIEARFSERMQEQGKSLHANLEFYKGIVYRVLGLSPDYFTTGFSMARVYGYLAHFKESRIKNILIRPGVKYTGKLPEH